MRTNGVTTEEIAAASLECASLGIGARNDARIEKLEALLGTENKVVLHGFARLGTLTIERAEDASFSICVSRAANRKERSQATVRLENPIIVYEVKLNPDGASGHVTKHIRSNGPKGSGTTITDYDFSPDSLSQQSAKAIDQSRDLDGIFKTIDKFARIPAAIRRDRISARISRVSKSLRKLTGH